VVTLVVGFQPDRRPFSSVEGLAMTARRTLLVAMAAALAATAVHLALALARWAAGDLETLVWEDRRAEAMDRQLVVSRRIIEGKLRVVAELIAGRLTLLGATGRFRELNALVEDDDRGVIAPYRVVTGEEALCRTVLTWVEAELWHEPDQAAAPILARLKAEYRQQFGHDPVPEYGSPSIPGLSPQPALPPAEPSPAVPALPPSACPPCDPGPANAVWGAHPPGCCGCEFFGNPLDGVGSGPLSSYLN
jgi:hypothetical protein